MAYKITLVHAGVPTDVTALAEAASVETITEGLDSHEVSVTWRLGDLRDDPAYDVIRYTWPGAMTKLELRREDTDVLVFSGQVHAVTARRADDEFTITAQS